MEDSILSQQDFEQLNKAFKDIKHQLNSPQMRETAKQLSLVISNLSQEMRPLLTAANELAKIYQPHIQQIAMWYASTITRIQNSDPEILKNTDYVLLPDKKVLNTKRKRAVVKAQKIMLQSQYVFDDFMLRWQNLPEDRFWTIMNGFSYLLNTVDSPLKGKIYWLMFCIVFLYVYSRTDNNSTA